jgi:hypothetical protein
LLSPTTEQVNSAVVQVKPPGLDVTVYESAPTEATHATVANPSPATAVTPVGADGITTTDIGVTAALGDEAADEPSAFVAVAVNV